MAAEFGKPLIVEFGTSFGISTMYMAQSCSDAIVYTIEGCPATFEIAKNNFKKQDLQILKFLTGSFDEVLPVLDKHRH